MKEREPPDTTRRRKLKDAGWLPVPDGWLPARRAARIAAEIARHAAEAERIAETPGTPGRPRKQETTE